MKRAWIIASLLAAPGPPAIAGETRNVLVVYSNSRLLPANIEADRALRESIATSAERSVAVFDEYLDVPRFGGPGYVQVVSAYLRGKYESRPPDVVVAAGEDALLFLLRHRPQLFPVAPVVHVGVARSFLRSIPPLPDGVVGVPMENDFSATIDQALRWRPQARRLVVVTGASSRDREFEARLREEVSRFQDRATAEFLAGLPTGAVLRRLGELGSDAVVITTGYFQDGEGLDSTPLQSVRAMSAAATAPVYGPFDTFLGAGIVGGYMPSFAAMGRQAGTVVNDLLGGAEPASIRLPVATPTALNVDWRQIRRWGIDEGAIPGNAVVHFREPTFLEEHRRAAILAAAGFLLQTGLIVWLLLERYRRRVAQQAVQKQRFELAHASRLAVAGELTGSIAHQINQPLGAILSNAEAAELILESGVDRRGELREILADIRRDDLRASEVIRGLRALLARHEVERHPFDLNEAVSDVVPVLRAEAQRRRVALDVRPAAAAVPMVGDPVQIQQVLMNLVLNAMDAVADAPDDRRTVAVSVENGADSIEIAVRDRGQGIAPEHLPRLFDSFFTTKRRGMGLGLSIARTLVEAHGGHISAENGPGEGAVFHVELPAARATGSPPPGPA